MDVFHELLKEVQRQRIDMQITYDQQDTMDSTDWGFILGGKLKLYEKKCHRLVDHLLEKGMTVHLARNRAGVVMPFTSLDAAERWLELSRAEGEFEPKIDSLQMALTEDAG